MQFKQLHDKRIVFTKPDGVNFTVTPDQLIQLKELIDSIIYQQYRESMAEREAF